jgi:magnesium transporter
VNKSKIGLAPGALVYTGSKTSDIPIQTDYIQFDDNQAEIRRNTSGIEDIEIAKGKTNWFNINGIHDVELVTRIGQQFGIHNLILEDVLNPEQLPKCEELDEHLYVTLKMLSMNPETHKVNREHVSLLLGKNYIISFQEQAGDVFEGVRKRISLTGAKIRSRRNDYLMYALMDAIVDHYFLVTEAFGNRVEELEEQILSQEQDHVIAKVTAMKKELSRLKKFIHPLEQVVLELQKSESPLIADNIEHFFTDLLDHIRQAKVQLEDQREMLTSLVDLHISLVSNEMNAIMKTLTIVAAIFIPLTFLAGIYGMNFEYMPELSWKWAYPTLISSMFVLGVGLWIYMKRMKWL